MWQKKKKKTGENKMHSKEQGYSGLLADTISYDRPKAKRSNPHTSCQLIWRTVMPCEWVQGSQRRTCSPHSLPIPVAATRPFPVKPLPVSQLVGRGCCYLPVQTAWGKQALTSHFLSKKYGKESDLQFIFTWNNLTNLASLQHLLLTWSTT